MIRACENGKQQELARWMRGHHRALRLRVQTATDETKSQARECAKKAGVRESEALDDFVWRQHLQDKDSLNKYAESMQTLATTYWKEDSAKDSRINWSVRCAACLAKSGKRRRKRSRERRGPLLPLIHNQVLRVALNPPPKKNDNNN